MQGKRRKPAAQHKKKLTLQAIKDSRIRVTNEAGNETKFCRETKVRVKRIRPAPNPGFHGKEKKKEGRHGEKKEPYLD